MDFILFVIGLIFGIFSLSNIVLPITFSLPKAKRLETENKLIQAIPLSKIILAPIIWVMLLIVSLALINWTAFENLYPYSWGLGAAAIFVLFQFITQKATMESDFTNLFKDYIKDNSEFASMSREEAEKIVNEYGKILEHDTKTGSCIPISFLPFSKEKIKIAIKTYLAMLKSTGRLDDQLKNNLEVGYVCLADFVNDDLAKIVIDTEARLNEVKKMSLEEAKQMFKLRQQPNMEEYTEILKAIGKEREKLLEEIKNVA